jgi:hypothetical protein
MQTENVSAQLFNSQLPLAQEASFTGCKKDFNTNYMTTCVDSNDSDKNIEDAFQKQMNVSDYYKSVQVFDKMKQTFDTNEGTFDTSENEKIPEDKYLESVSVPGPILPAAPRDSMVSKESFGGMEGRKSGKKHRMLCFLMLLIIFVLMVLLIKIK